MEAITAVMDEALRTSADWDDPRLVLFEGREAATWDGQTLAVTAPADRHTEIEALWQTRIAGDALN